MFLIAIVVSKPEIEPSPFSTYYRLTTIGGNGYTVATSSVMQSGILQDVGGILSVLHLFLVMKGLSQ